MANSGFFANNVVILVILSILNLVILVILSILNLVILVILSILTFVIQNIQVIPTCEIMEASEKRRRGLPFSLWELSKSDLPSRRRRRRLETRVP
jgi:hypothetical protein